MSMHYHEVLPPDLAKEILGIDYDDSNTYVLITDVDGTYITAYNKETNEHIFIDKELFDDIELDVDTFKFLDEEIKDSEYRKSYSGSGIYVYAVIAVVSIILAVLSVIAFFILT